MRLTQVVQVESYTVSGLYTESFHGNVSLTAECIFIIGSVLFILFIHDILAERNR